jgi:hypothetical protein
LAQAGRVVLLRVALALAVLVMEQTGLTQYFQP